MSLDTYISHTCKTGEIKYVLHFGLLRYVPDITTALVGYAETVHSVIGYGADGLINISNSNSNSNSSSSMNLCSGPGSGSSAYLCNYIHETMTNFKTNTLKDPDSFKSYLSEPSVLAALISNVLTAVAMLLIHPCRRWSRYYFRVLEKEQCM